MATIILPGLAAATIAVPLFAALAIEPPRHDETVSPLTLSAPAAEVLAKVPSPVPASLESTPLPGFESYEYVLVDGRQVVIDAESREIVEIFG